MTNLVLLQCKEYVKLFMPVNKTMKTTTNPQIIKNLYSIVKKDLCAVQHQSVSMIDLKINY